MENEFHGAINDAARAICAVINDGNCACRDTASLGTCSDKWQAAALGVATFMAHGDARTMDTEHAHDNLVCPQIASQISNRYLR